MKTQHTLPENYIKIFAVDLQKNKKLALFLSVSSLAIAVVMIVGMCFYKSIVTLFEDGNLMFSIIRMIALLVFIVVYMVLHELVHGVAMRLFGCKKVRYGFNWMYAYAGSDDYFSKASYITIALAPIVVLGIMLGVINAIVPAPWFWVVYFVQITNISGTTGDIYVTAKFMRMPKDILVRDTGTAMAVYSKPE